MPGASAAAQPTIALTPELVAELARARTAWSALQDGLDAQVADPAARGDSYPDEFLLRLCVVAAAGRWETLAAAQRTTEGSDV